MHVVEFSVFAPTIIRFSNQVRTLAVNNPSDALPAILTGRFEFAVSLIANCGYRWLIYGDTDVRYGWTFLQTPPLSASPQLDTSCSDLEAMHFPTGALFLMCSDLEYLRRTLLPPVCSWGRNRLFANTIADYQVPGYEMNTCIFPKSSILRT